MSMFEFHVVVLCKSSVPKGLSIGTTYKIASSSWLFQHAIKPAYLKPITILQNVNKVSLHVYANPLSTKHTPMVVV